MKYSIGILLLTIYNCHAFNTVNVIGKTSKTTIHRSSSLFPTARKQQQSHVPATSRSTASFASATTASMPSSDKDKEGGGFLSFKTKYGYLNPFAIYYGLTSILLGLPWFVALNMCQVLYAVTRSKVDKLKRLPTFFSHVWGILLLRLTRSYPEVVNQDKLDKFYKEGRAGMFVANHNSWMDIPFIGIVVGWRNYKLISKAELGKVPILGRSIKVGGHVMVDRTNRRSQLQTFKNGIKWLKDGVHLCAFPEGTRSKTGRLLPFKNGAFKMASKTGSPIIPFSIVASGKAHPANWMFPRRHSHGICKVVVHDPIETTGKTDDELSELVRQAIIDGLPEDQHPLV